MRSFWFITLTSLACTEAAFVGAGAGTGTGQEATSVEASSAAQSSQSSTPSSHSSSSAEATATVTSTSAGTGMSGPVNLADYFAHGTRTYRFGDGTAYARYAHFEADANFSLVYDTFLRPTPPVPGTLRVWQKAYYVGTMPPDEPCVATYAMLFFGDDGSMTEAGDYLSPPNTCAPSIVFGYQAQGNASGLLWSGPGGLSMGIPARVVDLAVAHRPTGNAPYQETGYVAYSHVELVEVLPTFTPAYGNGDGMGFREGGAATYQDVIRIVFHHGVREPGQVDFHRCDVPVPADEYTVLYRSEPGYNSYASEFYFSRSKGLIQEGFLYNEHNAYLGSSLDCKGLSLDPDRTNLAAYRTYVDEPQGF